MFNSAGGMKVFRIISQPRSDGEGRRRDGIRKEGQRMGEQRERRRKKRPISYRARLLLIIQLKPGLCQASWDSGTCGWSFLLPALVRRGLIVLWNQFTPHSFLPLREPSSSPALFGAKLRGLICHRFFFSCLNLGYFRFLFEWKHVYFIYLFIK